MGSVCSGTVVQHVHSYIENHAFARVRRSLNFYIKFQAHAHLHEEFLLDFFKKEAVKSSNVKQYQFWRHDNKPIELWSNKVIQQKIDYIHNNPVEEGLVYKPEEYVYSSAMDYAEEQGLIKNVVVFRMFEI